MRPANNTAHHYIGIMSGTSLDGADALLVDLSQAKPQVKGFVSLPFAAPLRDELLALNRIGDNEIERSHLAANALAHCYARAVQQLLTTSGHSAADITAIGCHGQTVRHRPDRGYTVQLNNPALLAELCGIDIVADFRSRDVAAGGQGAPLVPAFHEGVFRVADETRVVVNIGGIANLTILAADKPAWGFDCGPGNCLMDAWISQHQQKSHDAGGAWASQGRLLARLSSQLQGEPYFQQPPPKSTGRDDFNPAWLAARLAGNENPADVQATLLHLSAWAIVDHMARYAPDAKRLLVCGGGAQNTALMAELTRQFTAGPVEATDAEGVPAQQVEALAFAWFAKQCVERHPLKISTTTGARHDAVLGAIYPA
ncbi:MAG: anhydro-N-acetylmuramic acid kinase [Betaproteobacteria bacterium]|nr:anhydro-N-acetylmuramic acid kinase [Betaproteobacteria bacterium]